MARHPTPSTGGSIIVRGTLAASADRIARSLLSRPARAGDTRVLAIEGRSGAGKSTLADLVAVALASGGPDHDGIAPVVRMDDLYAGWDGLEAGVDRLVGQILAPLAAGRRPRWQRYDWALGAYGEWRELPGAEARPASEALPGLEAPRGPAVQGGPEVLVVEGVGAGARRVAPYLSGLVLVAAPAEVRRRRALARDGDTFAPHWERWAAQEERFYAAEDVAGRADLLVNGDLQAQRRTWSTGSLRRG